MITRKFFTELESIIISASFANKMNFLYGNRERKTITIGGQRWFEFTIILKYTDELSFKKDLDILNELLIANGNTNEK